MAREEKIKSKPGRALGQALDVVLRTFLEQSGLGQRLLRCSSARLITAAWSIFCLVLGTSYRSKLINFLTFLDTSVIPSTHRDLVDANYKLYFRYYGGVAYEYMLDSSNPIHHSILNAALLVNSSAACVAAAALTENSACLDYDFHGDYAIWTNATLWAHEDQGFFIKSKDKDIPLLMSFNLRKGSPFTESFDVFLLQTFASGLYDEWIQQDWTGSKIQAAKWLRSQSESELKRTIENVYRKLSSNPRPISSQSLYGAFIAAVVGLAFAILALLGELISSLFTREAKSSIDQRGSKVKTNLLIN
jgi:hypothetical protein